MIAVRDGALVLFMALASLAACSLGGKTSPSDFYVLSARPSASLSHGAPVSVLLGPLSLPDVVLRPQLVTRPEPGRIVFSEYHRWAGDLLDNVEQVLLQDLSTRMGSNEVIPAASGDLNTDYRVMVRFQRFDGALGRQVVLQGNWQIKAGVPACLVDIHHFSIEVPVNGDRYADYVRALDEGLATLSERIARTLVIHPGCRFQSTVQFIGVLPTTQ